MDSDSLDQSCTASTAFTDLSRFELAARQESLPRSFRLDYLTLRVERLHLGPRPDHYDGNPLVPPHFSVAPAMTRVEDVYRSDPLSNNRMEVWGRRNRIIRRKIKDLLTRLPWLASGLGRYGLYICGAPGQVLYRPDASGNDRNSGRDRMMVLMVELKPEEQQQWLLLQLHLERFLRKANIERCRGVCIRYYIKAPGSREASPDPPPRDGFHNSNAYRNDDGSDSPPYPSLSRFDEELRPLLSDEEESDSRDTADEIDASSTVEARGSESASTSGYEEIVWEYRPAPAPAQTRRA